jgi:hypothetical protein
VPEQTHAVLEDQCLANEKHLVLTYLRNVQSKVLLLPLEWLENNHYSNGLAITGTTHRHGSTKRYKDVVGKESGELFGLPGAEEIDLPVGCTVTNVECRDDDTLVFIRLTGYTFAGCIYKYKFHNIDTSTNVNGVTDYEPHRTASDRLQKPHGQLSIWRQSIVDGFQPDRWAVDQVWVPNPNDGVKIPMYIVHDKSLIKNGDSFCLLYGYHS